MLERATYLILFGLTLALTSCGEPEPIKGCQSTENCPTARPICINSVCVPRDPCAAGVFTFSEGPVDTNVEDPETLLYLLEKGISNSGWQIVDSQLKLSNAEGSRHFAVDFSDAPNKGLDEQGRRLGLFVEAKLRLDAGSKDCAAVIFLWPNQKTRARICIGGDKVGLPASTGVSTNLGLTDLDITEDHIYRLQYRPSGGVDGGSVASTDGTYELYIDNIKVGDFLQAQFQPVAPADRVSGAPLVGIGVENTGSSYWDFIRWGCEAEGGPCIPSIQDDDQDCRTQRQSGLCMGGRAQRTELCDGIDNDCDGQIDENFKSDFDTEDQEGSHISLEDPRFRDAEDPLYLGDSCEIGICTWATVVCHPTGKTLMCDVANNPGVKDPLDIHEPYSEVLPDEELCDNRDNNCNGQVDEDFRTGSKRYDDPTDPAGSPKGLGASCGVGVCVGNIVICSQDGKSAICRETGDDKTELCGDGIDNDCDGLIDESFDLDGDGYQNCRCTEGQQPCEPSKHDCDDGAPAVNPAAQEVCNRVDDNCDGEVDEGYDADDDTYIECGRDCPQQQPRCQDDCDDNNAQTYPGAPEICDFRDNDCDATSDEGMDTDGDRYYPCCEDGTTNCRAYDCNDARPEINPSATEQCNSIDDDCVHGIDNGFVLSDEDDDPVNIRGQKIPYDETEGLVYINQQHCGSCNRACSLPHAVSTCSRDDAYGQCKLVECVNEGDEQPDWANVDNVEANGCERSLKCTLDTVGSAANDIGNLCSKPMYNAQQDCRCSGQWICKVDQVTMTPAVVCRVNSDSEGSTVGPDLCPESRRQGVVPEACDGIDNDCDGKIDETFWALRADSQPELDESGKPIYSTVDHCGACNRACRTPNANPKCALGVCQIESCFNNFYNIDGRVDNGCEYSCSQTGAEACDGRDNDCDQAIDEDYDFQNDPRHCGNCSTDCTKLAGVAQAECVTGSCRIVQCLSSQGNCDGQVANGCETSLQTTSTCGSCNNQCNPDSSSRCSPSTQVCVCGDRSACTVLSGYPICDDASGDCVECTADTHCDEATGKPYCYQNKCTECDYTRGVGCAPESQKPICGITGQCGGCKRDLDCILLDPLKSECILETGRCTECDPATNDGCSGDKPTCDARTFSCRACESSADCLGLQCVAPLCVGCDKTRHTPCTGAAPICQDINGTTLCQPCTVDVQCANRANARAAITPLPDGSDTARLVQCVQERCLICDPADHQGCAANELCCGLGCVPTTASRAEADARSSQLGTVVTNQCQACGLACDELSTNQCINRQCRCGINPPCSGQTAFCDDDRGVCVNCRQDGDCGGNRKCVNNVCYDCNPSDNSPCAPESQRPFCDATNRICRPCASDQECASDSDFKGDYCLSDGTCQACNTANNAGCNEPGKPVCAPVINGSTTSIQCRACQQDSECANNPNGNICNRNTGACVPCANDAACSTHLSGNVCIDSGNGLAKRCGVCTSNLSCTTHPSGNICISGYCRSCQSQADCIGNPAGTECVSLGGIQRCAFCNPSTDSPCSEASPICNETGTGCAVCRNDTECESRAIGQGQPTLNRYCIEGQGRCRNCDPLLASSCPEAARPICDPSLGYLCRPCATDGECGDNKQCVAGYCRSCDPSGNAGCTDPLKPICDEDLFICGPCAPGECAGHADGSYCVLSSCENCNPSGNQGCLAGSNRPICVANGSTYECTACTPGLNQCRGSGVGDYCVGGLCKACDPSTDEGCTSNGSSPICDGANIVCRGCLNDLECEGKEVGEQCYQGSCELCDPDTDSGCNNPAPICSSTGVNVYGCRACTGDADCTGNRNGDYCVGTSCKLCDHTDNQGCIPTSNTSRCDPNTNQCVGCQADADCNANPAGGQCIETTHLCKRCDPRAGQSNAGCTDPTRSVCDSELFQCRPCANDGECPDNGQCVSGTCRGCSPDDNAGCDAAGALPICDDNFICRQCTIDDECRGNANGTQCLADGSCGTCDPRDHAGCNLNQLCCASNNVEQCVGTDITTQCEVCGTRCSPTAADQCTNRDCKCGVNAECGGATPYCETGTCHGCRTNTDCGADQLCCAGANGIKTCEATSATANGQCAACDTACAQDTTSVCTNRVCKCGDVAACSGVADTCDESRTPDACVECLTHADCTATSIKPFCDAVSGLCRAAANNGECSQATPTTPIRLADGSCRECNIAADCTGKPEGEICLVTKECGCGGTVDCDHAQATGEACLSSACARCTGDLQCPQATFPYCLLGDCVQCTANNQCPSRICNTNICVVAGCGDGVKNGVETDIDCGGGVCNKCTDLRSCSIATDCVSGVCSGADANRLCQVPTCTDSVKNGSETDIDCGGSCGGCAPTKTCAVNQDCASLRCESNACATPACNDSVKNGTETDTDCGGTCSDCVPGRSCLVATDCTTDVCSGNPLTCQAAGCGDQVKNGDETDIDCGGTCPLDCGNGLACIVNADCQSKVCTEGTCRAPTCTDTVANGLESGVDCGGTSTCARCGVGLGCDDPTDCVSLNCSLATSTCVAPTCVDTIRNQGESDTDCGGVSPCSRCSTGDDCTAATDCMSGVCSGVVGSKTCQAPACNDTIRNGLETGVDCGGANLCNRCALNIACAVDTDCQTNICGANLLCAAGGCNDGRKNGDETDVDCGGSCGACDSGDDCVVDGDCLSLRCDALNTCSDSCNNLIEDNLETDVDCGGGVCGDCAVTKGCNADSDCLSATCINSVCYAATCRDALINAGETDLNCGGSCPDCANKKACAVAGDCISNICGGNICIAAHCINVATDETETALNCGGNDCATCALGSACLVNTDCSSSGCDSVSHVCVPSHCVNGVKDAVSGESDIDCGGPCLDCELTKACASNGDCVSGACDDTLHCVAAHCINTVKDGTETGLDCGGADCKDCANGLGCTSDGDCVSNTCISNICYPATCEDAVTNGDETDLNCGGSCPDCANRKACTLPTDCASGVCTSSICVAATCSNGSKDGTETDIDCGGADCNSCSDGDSCIADDDCITNTCINLVCYDATCADTIFNGAESDTDCGGPLCPACDNGYVCEDAVDCKSNICEALRCVGAESCNDGLVTAGNNETDVDCGGGLCLPCGAGLTCSTHTDCASNNCDTGICTEPLTCTDTILTIDNFESQTDCGGYCDGCLNNDVCRRDSDCASSNCVAEQCVGN